MIDRSASSILALTPKIASANAHNSQSQQPPRSLSTHRHAKQPALYQSKQDNSQFLIGRALTHSLWLGANIASSNTFRHPRSAQPPPPQRYWLCSQSALFSVPPTAILVFVCNTLARCRFFHLTILFKTRRGLSAPCISDHAADGAIARCIHKATCPRLERR